MKANTKASMYGLCHVDCCVSYFSCVPTQCAANQCAVLSQGCFNDLHLCRHDSPCPYWTLHKPEEWWCHTMWIRPLKKVSNPSARMFGMWKKMPSHTTTGLRTIMTGLNFSGVLQHQQNQELPAAFQHFA